MQRFLFCQKFLSNCGLLGPTSTSKLPQVSSGYRQLAGNLAGSSDHPLTCHRLDAGSLARGYSLLDISRDWRSLQPPVPRCMWVVHSFIHSFTFCLLVYSSIPLGQHLAQEDSISIAVTHSHSQHFSGSCCYTPGGRDKITEMQPLCPTELGVIRMRVSLCLHVGMA